MTTVLLEYSSIKLIDDALLKLSKANINNANVSNVNKASLSAIVYCN